jgi:uncharacterized protein (DUF427 family)
MMISNSESPDKRNPRPSILVFDVNETLLDIEAITPLFVRVFGDGQVLCEWFGQLVLYSGVVTLSGVYRRSRFRRSARACAAATALQLTEHTTRHQDLGVTSRYTVQAGERSAAQGAWQHTQLPRYATELHGRFAFAWPAMDAFYKEDERIMGHAADSSHRIDIRQTSRSLVVRHRGRIIHIDGNQLRLAPGQTVLPHGPDRELSVAESLPRTSA